MTIPDAAGAHGLTTELPVHLVRQQDHIVRNPLPLSQLSKEARLHDMLDDVLVAPTEERSRSLRVSVVIPTLNEAGNLPHVLPRIPSWVSEVVLVDGNSTDGTVEVARELLPSIRVVMQQGRGKGNALRAGFAAVTGDIVVMLDADGSTDPREIPAYVGALLSGADFVKGSRFLQGGGTADMEWHRRAGNMFFVRLVRMCFGGTYSDLCYGYNAFWAWTVPLLQLDGDGFEIETMMNVRALHVGLKVAEVPSFEAPRINGVSRLRTFPDGWRVLKTIFRERRRTAGRPRPTLVRPQLAAHATRPHDLAAIFSAPVAPAPAPVSTLSAPLEAAPAVEAQA